MELECGRVGFLCGRDVVDNPVEKMHRILGVGLVRTKFLTARFRRC